MVKKEKSDFGNSKIKPGKKTLELTDERDIAMDFATKLYEKFGQILKSFPELTFHLEKRQSLQKQYY